MTIEQQALALVNEVLIDQGQETLVYSDVEDGMVFAALCIALERHEADKQEVSDVEGLESQIDRLATFIMENIPGEPSQSQGAVDTAIRLLATLAAQQAELDRIRATFDAPGGNLFDYVAKLEAENQRLRAALKEPS